VADGFHELERAGRAGALEQRVDVSPRGDRGARALGRRAAPGIVLVELVGPRGETLGRGRFVWLP
jgi:hypothetical protein